MARSKFIIKRIFLILNKIWLKNRLLVLWLILLVLLSVWARRFYLEYGHIRDTLRLPSITIGVGYIKTISIFLILTIPIFLIINAISKKIDLKFIIKSSFNYLFMALEMIIVLFVSIILWNSKLHPSADVIDAILHYIYYLIFGLSAFLFIEIIRRYINEFIKKKFSPT